MSAASARIAMPLLLESAVTTYGNPHSHPVVGGRHHPPLQLRRPYAFHVQTLRIWRMPHLVHVVHADDCGEAALHPPVTVPLLRGNEDGVHIAVGGLQANALSFFIETFEGSGPR